MRKMIILLALAFTSFPAMAECWDLKEISEIDGFSQLDGGAVFSVKDARTCKPIPGFSMNLGDKTYNGDQKGYLTLDQGALSKYDDDIVKASLTAKGYVTLTAEIPFEFNVPRMTKFLMTEDLPAGSARFVLQWGREPRDLDLHVRTDDFHISYRNKRSVPLKGKLDRDDIDGYGPETITLEKIEPNKTYEIFVDNFSNEKPFDREGVFQVYINNKLISNSRLLSFSGQRINLGKIVNGQYVGK